jgi:lysozyme family protein
MARTNFDKIITEVLKHEGGYVDHPADPGGATNFGITLATYQSWKKGATKADLKRISLAEVKAIYRKNYWDKLDGDELPSGVDAVVMDFGVNSGVSRAARYLQTVVGVTADGDIGKETMKALKELDPREVIDELCDRRLVFLKSIKHPKTKKLLWTTFGKGWERRVKENRAFAEGLAHAPDSNKKPVTKTDHDDCCKAVETGLKKAGDDKPGIFDDIVRFLSKDSE